MPSLPPFKRGPLVIQVMNNPLYFPRVQSTVAKFQDMMYRSLGRTLLPRAPKVLIK